jgi:hypothetical protein
MAVLRADWAIATVEMSSAMCPLQGYTPSNCMHPP